MDFKILITTALLLTELFILLVFVYHILKLKKTNEALLDHITKLDEHMFKIDDHIDKLDCHIDKVEEHSQIIDNHLKTILDYSQIHQMGEEEKTEFIEGLEESLEEEKED